MLDIARVISAIRSVLPPDRETVALHEPTFAGNEWKYVKECLDTGWVSSAGRFVDVFERRIADHVGVKRAVVVANGTAALHICLKLTGVEANDEVIVPTLTFIATANAVAYCGAVPHFADSDEKTLGLDPEKLRSHLRNVAIVRANECVNRLTGRRIRAVIAMHTFGHPVDLDAVSDVCAEFRLPLIEDAAESLGSYYKGHHTGTRGAVSALSFNGNKILTTGGGGAILTNDETLGQFAKHITTTAKIPHPWSFNHDAIGYNYRMPNLNAALGCAQLEQLPRFLEAKRRLAAAYSEALRDVGGARFFAEPGFARSNYWLNAILLDGDVADRRDELLAATNAVGIMTRPVWTPMHRLPMYAACPRMHDLSTAEDLERRILNLPSSSSLGSAIPNREPELSSRKELE